MLHNILFLLVSIFTTIIFFIKKQIFHVAIIVFSILIFISFILLFYQVFDAHDYYLINMTSIFLIIITSILVIIKKEYYEALNSKIIKLVAIIILCISTYITSSKTWARIHYVNHSFNNLLLYDNEQTKLMSWISWTDGYLFKVIEEKNFRLEHYGISKTDTIICLGDITINRSLYLLNRVGFTSYNCELMNLKSFIDEEKPKGLKYLILLEPTWKENEFVKPYLANKIFEKEATSIYRLK